MEMNVLYFCSDAFSKVAAVTITSLLENNKNFEEINIYLVGDEVSESNKQFLVNIIESKYNRHFIYIESPLPNDCFEYDFKDKYQMGRTWMRLCMTKVIPDNVDRVLCMDSDTLVLGDLSEMWNIDMKDNLLAGVADCVNVRAFKKHFMMEDGDIYCNAGMFMYNMKAWRESGVEERFKKIIQGLNGNVFFVEQTLLNSVCRGKIIKLNAEYNSYTLFYAFSYKNLIRWRKPTLFYTSEEVEYAMNNPKIIHYTNNFYMISRPWVEHSEHPMADEFRKYMKMIGWNTLDKDTRSFKQKFVHKLIHCVPPCILAYMVNFLYNTYRPIYLSAKAKQK